MQKFCINNYKEKRTYLLFFTIDPYMQLNKYIETVKNNTHK